MRRDLACGWLRMARRKNQEAVRCRRTALQARNSSSMVDVDGKGRGDRNPRPALVGHDFRPGDALRARVLREAARVQRRSGPPRWWLVVAALLGLGALLGALLGAHKASAGTLDLEVSVGANVTEYLSGRNQAPDGSNYDGGFAGPRDTIEFALVWRSDSGRFFCKLSHISHLSAGPPFNSRPEDFLERLEFGYRWRLRGAQ